MTESERESLCREEMRTMQRDYGLKMLLKSVFGVAIGAVAYDERLQSELVEQRDRILQCIYPPCPTAPAATLGAADVDIRPAK